MFFRSFLSLEWVFLRKYKENKTWLKIRAFVGHRKSDWTIQLPDGDSISFAARVVT